MPIHKTIRLEHKIFFSLTALSFQLQMDNFQLKEKNSIKTYHVAEYT